MNAATPLGPANPASVDLSTPQEVRWWCKQFGVTEEELRAAVAAAGKDAHAVCREIAATFERRPKATSRIKRGRARKSAG